MVFFHFIPHRESWHLLDVHVDLGLSIILYGGSCVNGAVRELLDYNCRYLLHWNREPSAYFMFDRQKINYSIVRTAVTNVRDIHTLFSNWCSTLATAKESYPSLNSFHYNNTQQHYEQSSNQRQSSHTSSSGMSVATACSILHIDEAQSHSVDAIRKAFRTLARDCHPDKKISDHERKNAHDTFTKLNEAKTYLESLFTKT